jgi:methylenetetrahydrofolate reductase (NADPH)
VRIDALLERGPTTSFEFFPPHNDEEQRTLELALGELGVLQPSFVSVTYRGGAASRTRTFGLVQRLRSEGQLEPMAHLTCVHHSRDELVEILSDYRDAGIDNLMLLGGDVDPESGAVGELRHANELVELARTVGTFCVGVAAQPAGHPDSVDLGSDRRHLAAKLALADFAVTQLFFEVDEWCRLRDDLAELGSTKPVLPGIMPVTTLSSIERMRSMGGSVPQSLVEQLTAARQRGPGSVRAAGIAAATSLCEGLLDQGAPGLHFYTLNRSTATREIVAALRDRRAD